MPNKPAASSAAGKGRATSKRKPAAAKRASSQQTPHPRAEYSEELVDRVCDEIAIGRSVKDICDSEGWAPNQDTWYKWMWRHPDVAEKYARAKEAAQHVMAAEMMNIIDQAKGDRKLSDWARMKMDAIKWQASKLAPKTFGEKSTIDLNVSDVDRDDKELLHELRTVSERLGVTPDAVVSKIARPN